MSWDPLKAVENFETSLIYRKLDDFESRINQIKASEANVDKLDAAKKLYQFFKEYHKLHRNEIEKNLNLKLKFGKIDIKISSYVSAHAPVTIIHPRYLKPGSEVAKTQQTALPIFLGLKTPPKTSTLLGRVIWL